MKVAIEKIRTNAKNITESKTFNLEKPFSDWFEKNYRLLGIDEITKKNVNTTPDFIVRIGETVLKVELETLSSHFILHKHTKEEVDLVICLVKDTDLEVETIDINSFDCGKKKIIKVQDDVWEKLMRKKLDLKAKSLNDVISKMLKLINKFKLMEELKNLE